MSFSPITDIIDEIRHGRMVILLDDEDRENEGDLVMAAEWVRPEDINFMARYGRGLVCLTLTRERCQQLKLPLMVSDTNDKHATNFTVSIEAARGVTTGISAADRAMTVRAAVAKDAKPEDVVQPGHIFPIMAQPGGVLSRAGHTEAGCDLARMAGLAPAAVIVEILNEDGTMARRPDLEKFAQAHGLKMGTIADLIHYRIQHEHTIEQVAQCLFPTEFGEFVLHAFRDTVDNELHYALVHNGVNAEDSVLVRVQMHDDLTDILNGQREGCALPMRLAMQKIAEEGSGIAILLRKKEKVQDLIRRIRHYHLQDGGGILPQPEPAGDLRTYGLGAQILKHLGVKRMRVIGQPKRMLALSGFGLEITEYVTV